MHERLRTHAESVAFFGGGAREKAVSYWQPYMSYANIAKLFLYLA